MVGAGKLRGRGPFLGCLVVIDELEERAILQYAIVCKNCIVLNKNILISFITFAGK